MTYGHEFLQGAVSKLSERKARVRQTMQRASSNQTLVLAINAGIMPKIRSREFKEKQSKNTLIHKC
jgi:hypothetical protein